MPRLRVIAAALGMMVASLEGATADERLSGGLEFPSPRSKWVRAETAHFTLISNVSRKRTIEIARSLEVYRAVLSILFTNVEVRSPVPTFLYIFRHEKAYSPYTPRYEGKVEKYGGWFSGYPTANYMALNGNLGDDPLDIFFHEYMHQIFNDNLPNTPLWFEEGLAECYSTFQIVGTRALIGKPLHNSLSILRARTPLPIQDLLNMTHRSDQFHVADDVGLIYSQSWAFVHYLLWSRPEGRDQVQQFLDRLRRGEDTDAAFSASFGAGYQDLQNDLRRYVKQPRFKFSMIEFGALDIDTRVEVAPIERASVLFRLGDLLARLGEERFADAQVFLRESIAIDPSLARSYATLGRMREWSGHLDEAIEFYEKAFILDRADYLINYLLGEALLDRADAAPPGSEGAVSDEVVRAQEMFRRSIQNRPGFAVAYVGYGRAMIHDGRNLGAAIRLMQAGRVLAPARSDIVMNLVLLHAHKGEHEEARALVENVLARMGDPGVLEAARRLLFNPDTGMPTAPAGAGTAPGDQPRPPPPLTSDPEVRRILEEAQERGRSGQGYNRQVEIFNEAVAVANGGDLAGAIAFLEAHLDQVTFSDLAEKMHALLEQMKKDLAGAAGGTD